LTHFQAKCSSTFGGCTYTQFRTDNADTAMPKFADKMFDIKSAIKPEFSEAPNGRLLAAT
jgi:hypothetical protein